MGSRTFIGIALPLLMRQTLSSAQSAMRQASPAWAHEKWVAEENLHITLKFLGDLPDELIDEVGRVTSTAVSNLEPFSLQLDKIMPVPRARSATMLWTMIGEGRDRTVELATVVDRELTHAGFPAETRDFRPHITLVRTRNARRIAFETLDAGDHTIFTADERTRRMSVREVTVYTSTLRPHGPSYSVRHVAPLAE